MARGPADMPEVLANGVVDEDAQHQEEPLLPPADPGWQKWLFLFACWIIEAMVFGFAFSFGVFQDFYTSHAPFAGSTNVAVIGTIGQGMLYFSSPFILTICRLLPRHAPYFPPIGIFLAALALAMASFCTTVPALVGTQGVLFGLGGGFAFCPCMQYTDGWFGERKGMAFGIMWGAAGIGGVFLPPVLQALLDGVGFRTAMRIYAAAFFAVTFPFAFFIRPRLPVAATAASVQPFNLRYLRSSSYAIYWAANLVHAVGYFLPSIYLPSYATDVFRSSESLSALTVIILNVSSACGCVAVGLMVDRLHVTTVCVVSAIGSTVALLLVWGLATRLALLYVFAFLYGLFAGGWTCTYSGVMEEVTKKGERKAYGYADPVLLMGGQLAGRGIGNMVSGPLSEALLRGSPWKGQVIGGYGSGYGALIVFTGCTALSSGVVYPLRLLGFL